MTVEATLYTQLSTYAGLTALVGTRISPPPAPVNAAYPLVTYQKIVSPRVHAMGVDPGLAESHFQVTVWGASFLDVVNVAEQVRKALQDFTNTTVQRVFYGGEIDHGFDFEAKAYQRICEVVVWNSE